jgi:hypothetical protein
VLTGMACFEAAGLCPRGGLCKPHYDDCREPSHRMFRIMEDYSPTPSTGPRWATQRTRLAGNFGKTALTTGAQLALHSLDDRHKTPKGKCPFVPQREMIKKLWGTDEDLLAHKTEWEERLAKVPQHHFTKSLRSAGRARHSVRAVQCAS